MIYILSCIAGGFLAGWVCRARLLPMDPPKRRRPYSSAAIAFCATQQDAANVSSQFINPAVGEPWPEPMTVEEWARATAQPAGGRLIREGEWRAEWEGEWRAEWALTGDQPRLQSGNGSRRGGNLGHQRLIFNEGRVQRGNGSGGPTTPKPDIVPKPQFPAGRVTDVWGCTVGYIPRSQGGTPNPPPREP